MAYEKNSDEQIWSKSATVEKDVLSAEVWSYKKGPKNLQLTRQIKKGEDLIHVKLGRLTLEEIKALEPLITEAKEHM